MTAPLSDVSLFQGLDTEEPLLQIDRYVFSGQHKDTDGTDVIFEHSTGSECLCTCHCSIISIVFITLCCSHINRNLAT